MNLPILPIFIQNILPLKWRDFLFWAKVKLLFGGGSLKCNLCGLSFRRMMPFDCSNRSHPQGVYQRLSYEDYYCPYCFSSIRHRLCWAVLNKQLKRYHESLKRNVRLLHFAPEKQLIPLLSKLDYLQYETADLSRSDVDHRLNLERLDLEDNSWDVIVLIHVLEHIENHRAAISEIFRVLSPGGMAVIMIPIFGTTTHEDKSITLPAERVRYYGQANHVIAFGFDLEELLKKQGFHVKVISIRDVFTPQEYGKSYINDVEGWLFLVTKPS